MHLSAQQFALFLAAFALAAVRLLTASKPFWNATPFAKWLTILGPAALAGFAAVPAAFSSASNWVDVGVAILTVASVALAAAHGDKVPPAALVLLMVGLCLPLQACTNFHPNFPALGACTDPLRPGLTQVVADILAGNGDAGADLATLGKTEGLGVVECAVQQLVSDIGKQPADARHARIHARGQAFLATVPR